MTGTNENARTVEIVAVLFFALLLRLPGIVWGIAELGAFHPDEYQHATIAYLFVQTVDPSAAPETQASQWNAPAFGTQAGLLGWPFLKRGFGKSLLYGLCRLLSLTYGLATVALVMWLAFRITTSRRAGLLAGLALAVFDLHVTYSHTGVPVVAYTFWAYAGLALIYLHWAGAGDDRPWRLIAGIAACCALALAMRFYVVLPCIATPVLVIVAYRQQRSAALVMLGFIVLTAGFFALSSGFTYGVEEGLHSIDVLFAENQDVIASDNHWLLNPLLYAVVITAGASVPMLFLAWKGMHKHTLLTLLYVLSGLTFLLFWIGDAVFVRRATIFLPLLAVLVGIGASALWKDHRNFVGAIYVYTLLLTLVSQAQFVRDTREDGAAYLQEAHAGAEIAYSSYARSAAAPAGERLTDRLGRPPQVVVLHETNYGRYSDAYLTTPFGPGMCCSEIYHCDVAECAFTQKLLYGESGYQLAAQFVGVELFPERIAYKHFFGTYETMLGDVRVYVRKAVGPSFRPRHGAS